MDTNRGVGMPARKAGFLAAVALFVLPPVTQAAGTPDSGTILQEVRPQTAPAPSSGNTGLNIQQQKEGEAPSGIKFEVKSIIITGNTVFDTKVLHDLVKDGEGVTLTLEQLQQLAGRITDYYHKHGYPLARAILPAQTIQSGVVRIEVLEARYGKIRFDNSSRVDNDLIQSTLAPLQSGQLIAADDLDHSLLLLSDIPGVTASSTLRPGEAVGTSDLIIAVGGAPISGSVTVDDYGNRYTGRARLGASVLDADPFHRGDSFSVNVLTSGSGLNYGRLGYDILLNGMGTRLGVSYSALHYILGDTLSGLQGHGTADVASVWGRQPLMRTRFANLYAQLQYDRKQLRDHIDIALIRTDRHLDNWTASLTGDFRDGLAGGAVNTWSLGWESGRVAFDDSTAQLVDALTAKTQGRFSKESASYSRLQSVTADDALYVSLSGQWANNNLDSAEKFVVGGSYSVRAYDIGVLSADSGYLGTLEWRHLLPTDWNGKWQAVAFLDGEHVVINHTPWAVGVNTATVSGGGLGLDWKGKEQWHGKLYVAAPFGNTPALLTTRASTRAWAEAGYAF